MRSLLLVLALLLSSPLVAAATYYAVVPSDGTASDVVAAANFAASMKASAGVSFTGVTDDDIASRGYDEESTVLVWLEGDEAIVEAPPGFTGVTDTAIAYLQDQGFSVTSKTTEDRAPTSMRVDEQIPDDTAEQAAETQLPEPDAPPADAPVIVDEQAPSPEEQDDEPAPDEPVAPVERSGFFARVWAWLKGLFS